MGNRRQVKILFSMIFAAILVFGSISPVDARPDSGKDIIRVLILEHFPPQFFATPDGSSGLGVEIPHVGGNTLFGNMYLAYEKLPAELKLLLADKTALHVYDYEMRQRYDTESGLEGIAHFTHPVFIRHPDTGRTALYVNRLMTARINELPLDESNAVLAELFELSEGPSVVYEHVWTVGDFVMWDNLCSIHARTDFPPTDRRLMRRCVIEGVRPDPA